jgi:hypothetical protein
VSVQNEASALKSSQVAPYPALLEELISVLTYKPDWRFELVNSYDRGQGSYGTTLVITVSTLDSYTLKPIRVAHLMPLPPASYDVRSWNRWLLDQILLVERHEACEFFTIGGNKPYAPSHGPGNDPYLIREVGTEEDVHTSFKGEVRS